MTTQTKGERLPMRAGLAAVDPVPPVVAAIAVKVLSWLVGLVLFGGLSALGEFAMWGEPNPMVLLLLRVLDLCSLLLLGYAAVGTLAKLHAIYLALR